MDPVSLWLGARALLARVPRWVWIGLAGAALMVGLVIWHGRVSGRAIAAAHDRGVAEERARWEASLALAHQGAVAVRQRTETAHDTISHDIGVRYAEDARRIGAAADALRLRGPGAAAATCPRPVDHPSVARPAGGHEPAAAVPDAPGPGVPAQDRATVPWSTWLVPRAEQFDTLLAENRAWREADERHRRVNETLRSAGADPPH